jgi:hypothetical protein
MSGVFSGDRLVLCPLAVAFLPSRSSRALAPLSLQPSHNIVLQLCVDVCTMTNHVALTGATMHLTPQKFACC